MNRDLKKEKAAGERSEDGRGYTNLLVGFSIRIPEPLQDWKLKTKVADAHALVTISDPDSAVYLSVGYQPLPNSLPATALAGMVEMGIKAVMPDYKKLREEAGEKPGYKFQDSWFTVTINDIKLNGVLRFVGRGSQAFYLMAMGKVEDWEKLRPAALSVMDTFTLFEPKSETP